LRLNDALLFPGEELFSSNTDSAINVTPINCKRAVPKEYYRKYYAYVPKATHSE